MRPQAALLALSLAISAACAYDLGPLHGAFGDAALCRGGCDATWDGCTLTLSTDDGLLLWTGPLSSHGLGAVGIGGLAIASPQGAAFAAGSEAVGRIIDAATGDDPAVPAQCRVPPAEDAAP